MAMQDLQRRAAILIADLAAQAASGDGLVMIGHAARYGIAGADEKRRGGRAPRAQASHELMPENVAGAAAVEIADAGDRGAARMHAEIDAAGPVTVHQQPFVD